MNAQNYSELHIKLSPASIIGLPTISNSAQSTPLETTGQKPGILFSLIRIVVTWAPFSPQLNDTLALLGRDRTYASTHI